MPTSSNNNGGKNNPTQSHIQKTINGIGHKMEVMLKEQHDKRNTSQSINSIQKDIANVLAMMKRGSPTNSADRVRTPPRVTSKC